MATRPIIYKYPLDLTGHQPNNLVIGEPQTLPEGQNRAVVPNYGAFYAESLKVRDAVSGLLLVPHEQFLAVQLYQEATEKTGLEVCAVVVVIDPTVSAEVELEYQAIGGEFSYSVSNLREMLDSLDLDARPVLWGDLIGRPGQFPPAPHLHDAGDLYGFEYLVEGIDSIRHAILVGQEAALGELRQYITLVEGRVEEFQVRCLDAERRLYILENEKLFETHLSTINAHELQRLDLGFDQLTNASFLGPVQIVALTESVFEDLGEGLTELTATYQAHLTPTAHQETPASIGYSQLENGPYASLAAIRTQSEIAVNFLQ